MTITISRNCCRVCLKIPAPNSRHKITELHAQETTKTIADQFMECSGVIIPELCQYAQYICKLCLSQLQMAYNFRNICKKSESRIQMFLRSQDANKNRIFIAINNGKTYALPNGISVKMVKSQQQSPLISNIKETNNSHQEIDSISGDNNHSHQASDTNQVFVIKKTQEFNNVPSSNNTSKCSQNYVINMAEQSDANKYNSNKEIVLKNAVTTTIHKIEPYFDRQNKENRRRHIAANKNYMTRPVRNERKKPDNSLVCEICGNVYHKNCQLRDHMQWHRGEKEFDCEICGKKFLRKSYMIKHLKKHNGIKPFKCNFCSRTFFLNGECRAHERTHSGIRKHTCEICSKSFMYSQALKNHLLIHEEIKLYQCKECDKEFRLMHHLKQHLTTKIHQNQNK